MNAELETALRQKLDFTEDDLTANRDGRLSIAQRNMLFAKKRFWLQLAGLAIGFVIVGFIVNLFVTRETYLDKIAQATMMCSGLAIALFYISLKWRQYTSDLENGIVFASEGRLELVPYYDRAGRVYLREIFVKKAHFIIDKNLFNLLSQVERENPFCVIYYTPKSNVLLSLELLTKTS